MATAGRTDEATEASDLEFPAVDADKELRPEENKNFEANPASSEVAPPLDVKQRGEVEQEKKEMKKKDALQTLKITVLVSAAAVAVAGAIFAFAKKLRQK